jgi:hypothetical protein
VFPASINPNPSFFRKFICLLSVSIRTIMIHQAISFTNARFHPLRIAGVLVLLRLHANRKFLKHPTPLTCVICSQTRQISEEFITGKPADWAIIGPLRGTFLIPGMYISIFVGSHLNSCHMYKTLSLHLALEIHDLTCTATRVLCTE